MEKTVVSAIKERKADQIVSLVESWVRCPDPNLSSSWDIRIGNIMWTRCIAQDLPTPTELKALLKIFYIICTKYVQAEDEFILRLKTLSVLYKFFVTKNKLVITDVGDQILKYVLLNYSEVTDDTEADFCTATCSFYGVIWNMMRENVSKLTDTTCLNLVSQSLQFLIFNLPEKLDAASGKLYQCNSVVLNCGKAEAVVSFVKKLVHKFDKIITKVTKIWDSSKMDIKIKSFEALYQITLTIARYLVSWGEFDSARHFCRTFISSWEKCIPQNLMDRWREMIDLYLRTNEFILNPTKRSSNLGNDLIRMINRGLNTDFENLYPGYQCMFSYNFAESVWQCMLHAFKNQQLITCCNAETKSLEHFLKGFKHFACTIELLPINNDLGVPPEKLHEIETNLLMLPLRFLSDRVNTNDMEITEEMCTTVGGCYDKVMNISSMLPPTNSKIVTDNYNRMCHCSSQIAFGYQKRKSYNVSLSWCRKATDSLRALKEADNNFQSTINPYTLSVLTADCNRHLGEPEDGLRCLSKVLVNDPSLMDAPTSAFDMYETPSWNDWNNHWNQLKRDLFHLQPDKLNQSAMDYIQEDKEFEIDPEFHVTALRHEMNSYFTNRQVIPQALLTVGEQLEDYGLTYEDKVLGLLAQIVAIWWSDGSQIGSALRLCDEARNVCVRVRTRKSELISSHKRLEQENSRISDTDDESEIKVVKDCNNKDVDASDTVVTIEAIEEDEVVILGASDEEMVGTSVESTTEQSHEQKRTEEEIQENLSASLMSGLVQAWKGLSIWRKNTAVADIELDQYQEMCANRRKKNREEGIDAETSSETDHVYVGNTSLTYDDEIAVINELVGAIDQLFDLIKFGDVVKALFDANCPALIMCTSRLLSHLILSFGHPIHGIKSWQTTFYLSKMYNRKGLAVLSASELLKLVCNPDADYVLEANKINELAKDSNQIKINKGMYFRLHLAHAVAYYHNKEFEQGLIHLAKVFKGAPEEGEQFDSTHHLMAEAYITLAWYKRSAAANNLDLSSVDELHIMSIGGLLEDGYRTLSELIREPDIVNSGWTDCNHNHFLMSTLLQNSSLVVSFFQESGLLYELRSSATEIVNYALSFACVSRCAKMLIYLAKEDLAGDSFENCIMKCDIINRIMQRPFPHHESHSENVLQKFIKDKLNIKDLTLQSLEDKTNLCWNLKLIENPCNSYGPRSPDDSEEEDIEAASFTPQPFRPFSFLYHPLNCCCYICTHPNIIPDALLFLYVQAKYCMGMKKPKVCCVILELTKRHHLMAMFRLIYNVERICKDISSNKMDAYSAYKVNYAPFFTEPGISRLTLEMEVTPTANLDHMIHSMKNLTELFQLKDPNDFAALATPVEMIYSAIMSLNVVELKGEEFLPTLEDLMDKLCIEGNDSITTDRLGDKEKLDNKVSQTEGRKSPLEKMESKLPSVSKVPKKGLKKYPMPTRVRTKQFTLFEDGVEEDSPPHPKPIPFSLPLVEFDSPDQEKENDEDIVKKLEKLKVRKVKKRAKPEKTRGGASNNMSSSDEDNVSDHS